MKLASALPKDHGLSAVYGDLIRHPDREHLVVAVVNCSKLTTDVDSDEVEPTVRVVSVEAITDEASATVVQRALSLAHSRRTGQLPLGVEVDPETGELVVDA